MSVDENNDTSLVFVWPNNIEMACNYANLNRNYALYMAQYQLYLSIPS